MDSVLRIVLVTFLGLYDLPPTMAAREPTPTVIVVGAGMFGITTAKTLLDAGIKIILILEATNRIGGRIRKTNFAGVPVELGTSWVEGVNGEQVNPIWTIQAYDAADQRSAFSQNLSVSLSCQGQADISILASQRLQNDVPTTPLDIAVDYYTHDFEFAEPPRVTSLQNTEPLPTFTDFGEDLYLVADSRGFKSVVYYIAKQFLITDDAGDITDPRLKLNKAVTDIQYSKSGVVIKTEDGSVYEAAYVMVSVSIGVLQTNLINFEPDLPMIITLIMISSTCHFVHAWKLLAIHQFDMAIYTKIILKFPCKFWPTGNGTKFFVYVHEKRGYYTVWQFLGANILLVTVTDEESRRIEQQPNSETQAEIMCVLRNMFGNDIPDEMVTPGGRVYFTGEHTSKQYNGYVHGAYLAGIDSANILIKCAKKKICHYNIKPKGA
ncbi:hypothetical protein MKX01_010257 [Papaver californicum]|nr:hypothetical protein MKX01_010257 [Papaver californicum]